MSSDDQGASYIATDANPAHKVQICYEAAWGGVRAIPMPATTTTTIRGRSAGQWLRPNPPARGQKIYLEGLFTEGGGGDNYSLAARSMIPTPAQRCHTH
jgi:hypothetical protein